MMWVEHKGAAAAANMAAVAAGGSPAGIGGEEAAGGEEAVEASQASSASAGESRRSDRASRAVKTAGAVEEESVGKKRTRRPTEKASERLMERERSAKEESSQRGRSATPLSETPPPKLWLWLKPT